MIDQSRFHRALIVSLLFVVGFCGYTASTPEGVFALAGAPGSPGARVYTRNLVIDGLGLYGASVDGRTVTHFDIGNLRQAQSMVIERDIAASSVAPGARDWTVRMETPYAVAPAGIDIYSANACVSGVGLTSFGLLSGLLDGFVNPAIANGHNPSLITALLNLIGPSGIIDITVSQFWAEAMVIDANRLTTPNGLTLHVTPRSTSPLFVGSCL